MEYGELRPAAKLFLPHRTILRCARRITIKQWALGPAVRFYTVSDVSDRHHDCRAGVDKFGQFASRDDASVRREEGSPPSLHPSEAAHAWWSKSIAEPFGRITFWGVFFGDDLRAKI
jgi:hypothetical protein